MSSYGEDPVLKNARAKGVLTRVALFLGELRDGLTMVCSTRNLVFFPLKSCSTKFTPIMIFIPSKDQYAKCIPYHLEELH